MDRAYSLLEIKSTDDDQRVIEGLATSPSTDRMGDIVEPRGGVFKLPLPFLWQHGSKAPAIGHVVKATVRDDGIHVRVQIEKDDQPGPLKDHLDMAWRAIKKGLVRGMSIGFRPLEDPEPIKGTFGLRFKRWEMLELSAVTIPANAEASITSIKHYASSPVSSGSKSPVASGTVTLSGASHGGTMFAARIRELKSEKATKEAQMQAVAQKAATEGRTMDAGEQEAFDTHLSDAQSIQEDIERFEKAMAMSERAAPVETTKSTDAAARTRGAAPAFVRGTAKDLPKGTGFARYAMALAATKGSISDALRYAERWKSSTPEVLELLEKANPGTTADSTFAAPLVYADNLVSEFIELLRPATVLGRIAGIRRVPFNVRIARQTAGMAAFNWVGEGAAKPVGELDFDTVTLAFHKIAGIVVLTDELVKHSAPNAEEVVRTDLVEQMARFIDVQFLRLTVAAGASNPASITNGVTPVAATGDDADALEADLFNALAPFDNTNVGDTNVTLIMQPKLARSIGLLRPDVGNGRLYPELTQRGGSLLGYPVITSNSVDNGFIVLVKGDEILLADDGSVSLDASREATIDAAGGNTPALSLWQKNLVGLRAERSMTWKKRRDTGAVSLISGAYYGPATVADS